MLTALVWTEVIFGAELSPTSGDRNTRVSASLPGISARLLHWRRPGQVESITGWLGSLPTPYTGRSTHHLDPKIGESPPAPGSLSQQVPGMRNLASLEGSERSLLNVVGEEDMFLDISQPIGNTTGGVLSEFCTWSPIRPFPAIHTRQRRELSFSGEVLTLRLDKRIWNATRPA